MTGKKVSVDVGDDGALVLTGNPADVSKVLGAMDNVRVTLPNPNTEVVETELAKNQAPDMHYAVFYDETGGETHRTNPTRLWSQAKKDASAHIVKNGQSAKTMIIHRGSSPSTKRGSRMARARTAWRAS